MDRPLTYILDADWNPQPCDDPLEWARWKTDHRHELIVAKDRDEGHARGTEVVEVSTVFMGTDFAFMGPPLLFETYVFNGPLHGTIARYSTRDHALAGHQAMCLRVLVAHKQNQ